MKDLAQFLKEKRRNITLPRRSLPKEQGWPLTVVRKIEQVKVNLNLKLVNHVLKLVGHELAQVEQKEIS